MPRRKTWRSHGALAMSHVHAALTSLRLRPGQAAFSLMGLALGIFSYLAANASLNALQTALSESLAEQGAGVMKIRREAGMMVGNREARSQRPALGEPELDAVKEALGPLAETGAEVWSWGNVIAHHGRRTPSNVPVAGATPSFLRANALVLSSGRMISDVDVQYERPLAIIGAGIADRLFPQGDEAVLGKSIELWGQRFEVIGTLQRIPAELNGAAPSRNALAILPLTTFRRHLGEQSLLITARMHQPGALEEGRQRARRALRWLRRLPPEVPDNFAITDNRELAEILDAVSLSIQVATTLISGLLLLVSGVGISNVLLASLYQRRAEIGVRMALGATPSAIQTQFLAEALLWALSGGMVGAVLSLLFTAIAQAVTPYRVALGAGAYLTAFLICAAVGLLAGWLPALRASQQMPAVALRNL